MRGGPRWVGEAPWWYLLGQDLSLQERIDGGQAAVLAQLDPAVLIRSRSFCTAVRRQEVRGRRGSHGRRVAEMRRGEPGGCPAGLSRNKGNTWRWELGAGGECPGQRPRSVCGDGGQWLLTQLVGTFPVPLLLLTKQGGLRSDLPVMGHARL